MFLGRRILIVLWVGSLWTIGLMVVPLLFASIDDRALAGRLAGELFTVESYLGLACGAALLAFSAAEGRWPGFSGWIVLAMVGLIALGEFGLQPEMATLKQQGLAESPAFDRLHGIASVLYLGNCLLGLTLVLFERGPVQTVRGE